MPYARSVRGSCKLLFQQPQYGFRGNCHLGNRTEAGAHVLYAGTKEVNLAVNDQETVVVAMRELYEFNRGILLIVFFEVGEELLAVAGVNSGRYTFGALGEQGKHAVVNEIVDENDSAFGASPILSELEVANCDLQFSNSKSFS